MPGPMATTPEQRLARLCRHALEGFARAQQDPAVRARAAAWLAAHPSAMDGVDALWFAALEGQGALAAWIRAGAAPAEWSLELPLHSVLACHPFPDLSRWTEVEK